MFRSLLGLNPLGDKGKRNDGNGGEGSVLKPHLLSKFGMARFIFNMITDALWYPAEEGRMLVLPARIFEKI